MLNERDIAFMKRTRDEVTHNRQRPLILEIVGEPKRNPITGVEEGGETVELTVQFIVKDRTSRVAAERRIQDQAEVVECDIWFSISIEQLDGVNTESIRYATLTNVKYCGLVQEQKGIGAYNHHLS